jgi:hypothetical protein
MSGGDYFARGGFPRLYPCFITGRQETVVAKYELPMETKKAPTPAGVRWVSICAMPVLVELYHGLHARAGVGDRTIPGGGDKTVDGGRVHFDPFFGVYLMIRVSGCPMRGDDGEETKIGQPSDKSVGRAVSGESSSVNM